jgi:hypothetical protein
MILPYLDWAYLKNFNRLHINFSILTGFFVFVRKMNYITSYLYIFVTILRY